MVICYYSLQNFFVSIRINRKGYKFYNQVDMCEVDCQQELI